MMKATRVDENSIVRAIRSLISKDEDLARIVAVYGAPPLWKREPGFPTLVYIILEQQVSLASAKAAYMRLTALTPALAPQSFLRLDDTALKGVGFSRQKIVYARGLARAIIEGKLNLTALDTMSDAEVRAALTALKGIGQWTADIYLLMALGRPDVWPSKDLGLIIAVQRVKNYAQRPTTEQMEEAGLKWQPWRAVATRILWHYYLSGGLSRLRAATSGTSVC